MKGKYLALAGMLLASCAQTQGREFYEDRINRASSIEVRLKTVTKVNESTYEQDGFGFVLGNYVFSRDHVTSRYSVPRLQMSPYGFPEVPGIITSCITKVSSEIKSLSASSLNFTM